MEYRLLGRTGVSVSKLCLGAMMFGEWGTKDHDDSIKIIRRALDGGISLIEMAIAFVVRHPAITSAIIGPRTMEHLESQLTSADVTLSEDVLDRIDQIVAPGVTINPADNGWVSPALQAAARRR